MFKSEEDLSSLEEEAMKFEHTVKELQAKKKGLVKEKQSSPQSKKKEVKKIHSSLDQEEKKE